MSNLTLCPNCKRTLVSHEEAHVLHGEMFCSRSCAIEHTVNDIIINAREAAIEDYACNAEVVSTADVLREDLYTIEIIVTCKKSVTIPKSHTEQEALEAVKKMYKDFDIEVDPADCDESNVTFELVKEDNSSNSEEA